MNDIWVAVIGGLFLVLVALVNKTRSENARDHAENGRKLDGISYQIGKVEQKIDHHITHHKDRP